jgi:2,5-diketo-D-gluconate reductase A
MEHKILNIGVKLPLLGFGVYRSPISPSANVVFSTPRGRYTPLIDTAAAYENEEAVGRAIQRSGVPRDQVFVTTKLWGAGRGLRQRVEGIESAGSSPTTRAR